MSTITVRPFEPRSIQSRRSLANEIRAAVVLLADNQTVSASVIVGRLLGNAAKTPEIGEQLLAISALMLAGCHGEASKRLDNLAEQISPTSAVIRHERTWGFVEVGPIVGRIRCDALVERGRNSITAFDIIAADACDQSDHFIGWHADHPECEHCRLKQPHTIAAHIKASGTGARQAQAGLLALQAKVAGTKPVTVVHEAAD